MAAQSRWTEFQCRVCGVVIQDHRERRLLHSVANSSALHELKRILVRKVPSCCSETSAAEVDQLLLPANKFSSTPGLRESYICRRPCHASLEKISKMNEKMSQLQREILAAESELQEKLVDLYSLQSDSDVDVDQHLQLPAAKRSRQSSREDAATGLKTPLRDVTSGTARRSLNFVTTRQSPGVAV